jgi:hypothetical protein
VNNFHLDGTACNPEPSTSSCPTLCTTDRAMCPGKNLLASTTSHTHLHTCALTNIHPHDTLHTQERLAPALATRPSATMARATTTKPARTSATCATVVGASRIVWATARSPLLQLITYTCTDVRTHNLSACTRSRLTPSHVGPLPHF